ncbi:MAG: hypothetical protein HY517_04155 [Candidatus Aenigmarchaeota archaeon]|nr:hypothetical protein [Candidatus Aenigmarchaeota archaeon]
MKNVVYVEAITKDADIQNEIFRLYKRLVREKPGIPGFCELYPITSQFMLDTFLSRRPEMKEAVQPLTGIGMWTEWDSAQSVTDFFRGPMHGEFTQYAMTTFGRARYRIVQLDGDKVKIREIPD